MFNLDSFNKIRKVQNKILNDKNLDPKIVSNQYLFLTRFHPQLMSHYFIKKNNVLFNKFKIFLPFIYNYFKDFFSRDYYILHKKLKKKKIIFITSIDQKIFLNKKNNHLNELIEILKDENYCEIIKSHFSINLKKNINFKLNYNKKKIFLKNNIGFFQELKIFLSIYSSFKKYEDFFKRKYDLNNKILKKIFSINGILSSINNYRFYLQLTSLFKILNPKVIIFPYEGNAWERLIVKAAKGSNTSILCIGYQKSVITKFSDIIRMNLKNNLYNPDKIICKSKIDYNKLLEKGSLNKKQLIVGGKYKKLKINIKKIRNNNFIVLPEAWLREEKNLLKFTLSCAKLYPTYNFIFRPHPSSILKINKLRAKNVKNFRISKNSLSKDINDCNFIFYRGSYSVIEACKNGLIPIYIKFENDFESNINPLYEIENKIFQISDPLKLKTIVKYTKTSQFVKRKLKILDHCNKTNLKLDKNLIRNELGL